MSLNCTDLWHRRSRNIEVGDVVILQEDGLVSGKWPLGRIMQVHAGKDGIVRVELLGQERESINVQPTGSLYLFQTKL